VYFLFNSWNNDLPCEIYLDVDDDDDDHDYDDCDDDDDQTY
jgi:hypothetical protein